MDKLLLCYYVQLLYQQLFQLHKHPFLKNLVSKEVLESICIQRRWYAACVQTMLQSLRVIFDRLFPRKPSKWVYNSDKISFFITV